MVGCDFSGDIGTLLLEPFDDLHTSLGADMCDVNAGACHQGDLTIAVDHRSFCGDGVSRKTELVADTSFVHHTILSKTWIFGVCLDDQVELYGIFTGASHQVSVLDGDAVICDHHRACFLKGGKVRE